MQGIWTGADATALREALGLSQPQFALRAGIAVSTVKKWKRRGTTVQLLPFFAELMSTMLQQATPEQRRRFVAHQHSPHGAAATGAPKPVQVIEVVVPDSTMDIWSADCTTIAHDLTRKDLVLDRRQISKALAGLVVGLSLLEPLERWLSTQTDCPPMDYLRIGSGYQGIEQLENTARAFREWDDQFGGGLRRKAVVGQLSEVNEMLRDAHPPQIKRRLLRVLALLAETTATMSWDSGEQETAQKYYMLAIRAANAAGDPALCANAIAGMARQLMSLDHYGTAFQRADSERERAVDALELIRLAQDRLADRVTPTVRAMLHTREAWAYGKLGRLTAFRRSCDKAYGAFADYDSAEDPYWINYFDAAELHGTLGGRLLEIARREPSFAAEAAENISTAISLRQSNRLRSSALDQLGIVEARMIQGELDDACRLGQTALDTVEKTGSDRVRKKLLRVYDQTGQLRSVRPVAELRDRMRPMVSVSG